MIATVPSWPARPLFRGNGRGRLCLRQSAGMLGQAMEVVGLVIFVTVLGAVPALVAIFAD
jgi:hypothetical protein